MLRAILASAVATAALAMGVAAGWSGVHGPAAGHTAREEAGTVTLRMRYRLGPWKQSLYLKLNKLKLSTFSVCGIRNWQSTEKFGCDVSGSRLPEQMSMRIEQSPIAKALRRDDTPGWGMLGFSQTARIGAAVSNVLTGDKYGTYRYRVTLRDSAGKIVATSNIVKVTWHR